MFRVLGKNHKGIVIITVCMSQSNTWAWQGGKTNVHACESQAAAITDGHEEQVAVGERPFNAACCHFVGPEAMKAMINMQSLLKVFSLLIVCWARGPPSHRTCP